MFLRVLAAALLFTAPTVNAAPPPQKVPQSPPPAMLVQTEWLATHLSDKNLVVLHVGADRTSYNMGHIPGARFLALSDIVNFHGNIGNKLPAVNDLKSAFERLGVGDHSRVILYGDMFGVLAARAYFTLDYLGHGSSAALLDGGLEKWAREQGTVQTVPTDVAPATLTVRVRPELIVELPALKEIVANKTVALIDARQPSDYAGAMPAQGIARPGHIPGATNVFWAEMLVSRDNPVLRPVSEIRARYASIGLRPGAKVIVYCQSGMQAAHDYFTLKLSGFRPVLYEGSFFDWSNAAGTPVEVGAGG